ncbi:type III secretion system export apparatus subunit SctS [Leisingera sp. SS27]|uniref:type III secretion system export apparatus subunit SctS n=1 Tax=unclassified Leisingera TaxID=2614906 RepID=UPI00232D2A2D|nr:MULTISPECIES: type III secretion system export apparatus subunit SctS [unclassified Leisingera]MDC0659475.1 type III secretion system export apparatus subunit SctS [Leisingera sp. SS27]
MSPNEVMLTAKNAVLMVFYLSMPIIIAATVVGLIIALLQTLIQLQEQTLAFAAKLAAVVAMFFFTGSWMSYELLKLLEQTLDRIGGQ